MKITVLTLFPEMISGFLHRSILGLAQNKSAVQIEIINIRDFATDKHKSADDKPYGGGAGMVLKVDVVKRALDSLHNKSFSTNKKQKVILTSPRGRVFDQSVAQQYSSLDRLIIICGRYEGVDERLKKYIDEEVSIGDFVLTGGEIAAVAIVEATARLLPGTISSQSANEESFMSVPLSKLKKATPNDKLLDQLEKKGSRSVTLLEYPQYTRPQNFDGQEVPRVLISGNHEQIELFRLKAAWQKTKKVRPDLLK